MNAIQIIFPTVFAVTALIMCFFRKMPACLVAYAAFVIAGVLGAFRVPAQQYFIWGVIAVADTVNVYMTQMVPSLPMRVYTVVGCFVGCLLGIVLGGLTAVLIAGALGAIAGFFAFTRTPRGRTSAPLSHQLSMFANAACTPWFTFVILTMVYMRMLGS